MWHQWLTLLIITLITNKYAIASSNGICRKTSIEKEPCTNGTRNIRITTYVRDNGVCTPFKSKTSVYCESRHKRFCKCSAVGDPHYRTYDGQVLHFYGDCRYTLTHFDGEDDPCSFNIEVQNEYRGGNKHFTYTKSVIIHMFRQVYELGQHRTLKVNHRLSTIPYEKNVDVRIFKSHQFLQFVAPKCSVRVAFDGDSNAFVEVSKRYSGKMNGICGNCNGKRDDFKTKSGRDVSNKKNKYSLIGNSYNVSTPNHQCKPAKDISYEGVCGKDWIKHLSAKKYCGGLLEHNNPFSKCAKHGHVDIRNFYQDCVIDMCVNKNKPKRWQKVRCEIFSGLAEVCSEAGFEGIKWRTALNCPIKCGKNAHFSAKANPCPRTCENHFYGTKRPCYDLPEREGCVCNKGYIRDGALCVKPMHCKCINLCVDRESSEKCEIWKRRGQCQELSEAMNIICPKTCGFCKSTAGNCEDELSARKCLEFRNKGLCFHDFYQAICGLTCNYDKCNCGKEKVIVGKCDEMTNRQTTTHIKFARDSNGRCAKIISNTHKPCKCHKVTKEIGRCNYCNGIRNVTLHIKEVVANKCVRKTRIIHESCNKCHKRAHEEHECIDNRLIRTTISFHRLNGCYHCVFDRKTKTREIKCKSDKIVRRDRRTCLQHTKIIRRRPVNCKCIEDIITLTSVWCCNKKPKRRTLCKNGKIIHRTIYYKFRHHTCVPVYRDRIEIPKCKSKSKVVKGKCERYRHGKFYCKAIHIKIIHRVNQHCKCVRRKILCRRTCCCKHTKHCTTCNRRMGILTISTIKYNLVKRKHRYVCVRCESRKSTTIRFKTQYIVIKGKCHSNCIRKDKIIKKYRDGCRIKTKFYRNDVRLCCCIPKHRKVVCCLADYLVTRVYKRILKHNRCVNVLSSTHKKLISCPRPVKISKCVYHKRKMKITKISYVLSHCRCKRRKTICYERCTKCQFKEIDTKIGNCDKDTCQRTVYTFFQNEDCQKGTRVCYTTCCCRFRKRKRSYCDRCNGIRYDIYKWWDFDEKLQICIPRSRRVAYVPKCKKGKVVKGKCEEERKYFIKITTTKQVFSKSTCKCRKFKCVTWKVCKCPPRKIVKKKCLGSFYAIKEFDYQLDKNRNKCLRKTIRKRDHIFCAQYIKTKIKNITKCIYRLYTGRLVVRNCHCVLHWTYVTLHRCCDEKPIKTVKCVKKRFIVTTTTTFSVTRDKKRCVAHVKRNSVAITCRRYINIRKTRCKKGIYLIITKYYAVVNCKCVQVRTTRIKKICRCIPSVILKHICVGTGVQKITTRFTLIDEKCIPCSKVIFYPTKCPPPVDKRSRCNRKTGFITVRRIYYTVQKCKCIRRKVAFSVRCPCFRKDRVRRKHCDKHCHRIVEIQRLVFWKRRCIWKVIKSYSENCCCPRNRSITRCIDNGIYRTKTVKYHLKVFYTNRIPLHKCVKWESEKDKRIECNRGYSSRRCVRHRILELRCVYKTINCRCTKCCRTIRKGPCECERLNRCKEQCIKNVRYNVCFKFKPGRKHCVKCRHEYPIREGCPRPRTECKSCSIHKNNGLYRICINIYFVYSNCRYIENRRSKLKLCKCDRDKTSRPRCIKNRTVIETTSFYRVRNHCYGRKRQHFIIIDCVRPNIKTKERKCFTKYKLVYYVLQNCKCTKKTLVRKNSKCCRKTTVEKKCKKNYWVYIQKSFSQKPTNMKLFPEINSPILATFCQITRKRWVKHICCPPGYKTEVCNTKTDRLTIKNYYYVIINCQCKLKVTKKVVSCVRCPKTKIIRSVCGPRGKKGRRYRKVTIKKWHKTKANKCVLVVLRRIEVCECEKTKRLKECKHGHRIFTTIWYNINTKPVCRPTLIKKVISISCYNNGRKNKWILVKTDKCHYPGKFTVKHFERDVYNSKTCSCKKESKSKKTGICCNPTKYKRRCRHNFIEHISISEVPHDLKCRKISSIKRQVIHCRRPITEVVGNCHGVVIRYRVTSFRVVKCRCIKKISYYTVRKPVDRLKCVRQISWRRSHVPFKLVNGLCVAQPPRITYVYVGCPLFIRFVDKKIDECRFKRLYIGKYTKNCVCVDRIIRTIILNYRCCQKDVVLKTCYHHGTKVTTIIRHKLLNFKCYPVKKIFKHKIRCLLKRHERKSTGLCTYIIKNYAVFIKNCKCYRKLISVNKKENCCHHRKPHTKYRCDSRKGQKLFIYTSYQHTQEDTCVKLVKIKSVSVNCHRLRCSKIESRCIHNTLTVQMYCYIRKGCKCFKVKVKEFHHCCGSLFKWIKTGLCGQHRKDFKRVRYYRLKLDKHKKLCRAFIVKEQYKRCRCPRSFTTKKCVMDKYNKVIKHSYILKGESCHLIKKEKLVLISKCPKKTTVKIRDFCNKKTGWRHILYKTTYPKHCKCQHDITREKKICICSVAFPSSKEKTYCKNDNIIVKEKRVALCDKTTVKWTTITISIKIVHCNKIKIEIGNCYRAVNGYAVRIRYDTVVQYFTKNCRCQRRVVKRILKHCACRSCHHTKQCVGNTKVIKNYSYVIIRGRCQQRIHKTERKIPCPTRPHVTKSRCKKNKYIVTKRTFILHKCRCETNTTRKKCDCKCRRNRKYKKCSGNYFILEVSIKYHKKHCRCIKRETIKQIPPVCPRFIVKSRGPCLPGKFASYREIIHRRLKKYFNTCQCKVKEWKRKRICACPKTIVKRKHCIRNHIVVEVWGWKINKHRNRCERYQVSSNTKAKHCPKSQIRRICNRQTGRAKKITVIYHVKHCKCLKKVYIKRYRCRCKETPILVEGRCIPHPTCRRVDKYRHEELRKGHCVKKFTTKVVTCCCPKKQHYKKCEGNCLVSVNISYVLHLGKCVKMENSIIKQLKCSRKIYKEEGQCGKNGFKSRKYYREKLRSCKCVREMVDEDRCQCRCKKNRRRSICNKDRRFIKTISIRFHLKNCKCERKKTEKIHYVNCPHSHTTKSNCLPKKGTNYWLVTTRTTEYNLNNRCKCVARTFKSSRICRCRRHKRTTVSCNAVGHALIYKTRFTVLRNGQCIKITKTKTRRIKCNGHWKLKSDSGCQPHGFYGIKTLTYTKLVHDKCRCKEISKTKTCHCACSGPSSSTICVRERIHHKIFKYRIIKCKCRQLIASDNVSVKKCKKLRPRIGKCRTERNRCVRYIEHRDAFTINCKCHYRRRIERRPCQTCPCPHSTHQKCHKRSNRIIITRIRCHILPNGWIKRNKEVEVKHISCFAITVCKQLTKCHKKSKTQKFICTVPHKENCECRSQHIKKVYPCKCKPDEQKRGRCNRKTCLRKNSITKFHLTVLTNNQVRCREDRHVYREKCCCPNNPKDVVKCVHNRLIRRTIRYSFDKERKTCNTIERNFDETPICRPAVRKIPGKCDKKRCLKKNKFVHKKLVHCRCQKRESVEIRQCCCRKKDYVKVKCIRNVSKVFNHLFVFKNGKCLEFVSERNHIIKCRRSYTRRGRCNWRTGFRILRIHKYRLRNCNCIHTVKVKEILCKCPLNKFSQICLKDKGIIRNIYKSYRLNERRNKCDEIIRYKDQQKVCNKNEKTQCSSSRRREDNGIYRKCITTWEERSECKCEEQIHWILSLLKCKKSTTTKRCVKNRMVTTRVYYVKERSKGKNHDYKCIRKQKILISPKIMCAKPYVTKTRCINSFRTYTLHYYTRTLCQCVSRIKVFRVRCRCKCSEEISRQCIDDTRIRSTIRAYKLQCDRKLIPNCRCIFVDTSVDKDVKCPDDSFKERCENDVTIRTWTTYDIQNCKCVADSQTDSRPGCKETICKDLLSNHKCLKIKRLGKCNQLNVYYQFLCPLTCGYCESCDKPSIKKYLSDCECRTVAGKRICSRSVLVIEFVPKGRKCLKVKRVVESLCDCSNILPNEVCAKSMKQGRCRHPRIRHKCAYHCNPKCQHCERNRVYKVCLQDGPNKGKYQILRINYFKIQGACFFVRRVSYEGRCEICDTKRTKTVTSCFEGKRFIITKYVKRLPNGVCINKERREVYSCADCCNEIITKISACNRRSRVVVIFFWANIKGCCRKQRVINRYACNRHCATIKSVRSKCMYNKQLVIKTWYSDKMCLPHTVYEVTNCHP